MKLLVTIWMDSNIAFFTKSQSGFLTWGAPPFLSLSLELHIWLSTTFLQGRRYLLFLILEDIYNMYRQYFAEIAVNSTCVIHQSASVDGTGNMNSLLIDPKENWPPPFLATMTHHVRPDVLIKAINSTHTFII